MPRYANTGSDVWTIEPLSVTVSILLALIASTPNKIALDAAPIAPGILSVRVPNRANDAPTSNI